MLAVHMLAVHMLGGGAHLNTRRKRKKKLTLDHPLEFVIIHSQDKPKCESNIRFELQLRWQTF